MIPNRKYGSLGLGHHGRTETNVNDYWKKLASSITSYHMKINIFNAYFRVRLVLAISVTSGRATTHDVRF